MSDYVYPSETPETLAYQKALYDHHTEGRSESGDYGYGESFRGPLRNADFYEYGSPIDSQDAKFTAGLVKRLVREAIDYADAKDYSSAWFDATGHSRARITSPFVRGLVERVVEAAARYVAAHDPKNACLDERACFGSWRGAGPKPEPCVNCSERYRSIGNLAAAKWQAGLACTRYRKSPTFWGNDD